MTVVVLVMLTCQGEGTRAPGWSWWRTAGRRVPQPELSVQDWSFYSPAAATKSYKPFVSASLPPPINLKEGEKNFGGYSFHTCNTFNTLLHNSWRRESMFLAPRKCSSTRSQAKSKGNPVHSTPSTHPSTPLLFSNSSANSNSVQTFHKNIHRHTSYCLSSFNGINAEQAKWYELPLPNSFVDKSPLF